MRNEKGLFCEELCAAYDDGFRLESASFALEPGRVLGVLGPNGSGKSTLLHCLAGVLPLVSGTARWAGQDLALLDLRRRALLMAVLLQRGTVPHDATALQLAVMGRYAHCGVLGNYAEHDYVIARESLEMTGCGAFANRPAAKLSGGELQRVLLARCFAQESPLLLLDEPATALDPAHALELGRLLRHLARNKGKAVLLTLHDLNLAAMCCDTLLFLRNGSTVASGSVDETFTAAVLADVYGTAFEVILRPGRPPQAVFGGA